MLLSQSNIYLLTHHYHHFIMFIVNNQTFFFKMSFNIKAKRELFLPLLPCLDLFLLTFRFILRPFGLKLRTGMYCG